MRVLLVNDHATALGGAEAQMLMLRDALRGRGHDARLFASSAGAPVPAAADELCLGTTSWLRTPLQVANPSARRRLREVIGDLRPDVVHVRMFLTQLSPLILPLLRDVPSILHVAWYRPICPRGTKLLPDGRDCAHRAGAACLREGCLGVRAWPAMMAQLALLRRGLPAFSRVITLSEPIRARLVADGMAVDAVVRNGVLDRGARPALAEPPVVAFAGRLVVEKGADVLLRAFAQVREAVPEARLVVAGDGPERGRLASLADELGVAGAVSFAGVLDGVELERRLASAWVQALPGRWVEPFGNVAAEALMRGTAVVATAPGGAVELVGESGAGEVVARGDAEALAAALVARLRDRDRCEAEGARGRAWALEHLRHDVHVAAIERLYEEVCAA